jgi:biopolymer transport protein ExbD
MTGYSKAAGDQPMMDINTTPLIDVMLVLLIMFIITIPIQNHAVKLDSPGNPPTHPLPPPTRNEIAVTHGDQVLWNGAPVDLVQLRRNLDMSQQADPLPELTIRPAADARYEVVDKVLAVTKRAQITRMGFVGNEAYAHRF